MANKICVLPEGVAIKIAAGEVVERPASVVKELVENSLDAGSHRITVEVKGGGRELVRVIDDGCGMNREDAALALERYSTSKISKLEDLEAIRSLGFRGEALPSIAAVSQLELLSRTQEESAGTRVRVEGGKVREVREAGCPSGTRISVRNLFFNVPARRKFLKTVTTEMGHISELVGRQALIQTDIFFQLIHNGQEVFTLPSEKSLRERIAILYGGEIAEDLIPLNFESHLLKLKGFLTKPTQSRSRPAQQLFYVNHRPIRSRSISHALFEGYRTLLPTGRFPVAFLLLEISPSSVDINVHPTKREVKFREEGKIHDLIVEAVKSALGKVSLIPEIKAERRETKIKEAVSKYLAREEKPSQLFDRLTLSKATPSLSPLPPGEGIKACPEGSEGVGGLTQFHNTYIISQEEGKLIIFDQHAAHERILYERLKAASAQSGVQSQSLLFPITLQLSPQETATLSRNLTAFTQIGFEIEEFGRDSFLLRGLPSLLDRGDPKQLLLDIIDDLAIGKKMGDTERKEKLITIMACRGAIKAGDRLKPEEMSRLLRELAETSRPYTCPHGRPTMIKLTVEELEKKFRRS